VRRALFERLPDGSLAIIREIARLLFRRPVVGIVAVARRADGALLLIRRGDTGTWALPGGTMEWGECARDGIVRELAEEAGAEVLQLGRLVGVFSEPQRDPRVHGVTIAVEVAVADALRGPANRIEILDAGFFPVHALPGRLAFGMDELLQTALQGQVRWT
jgi:8-oxo-dGTP diphosphatase